MPAPISHALVLPDKDFNDWYRAAQGYLGAFDRVVVVRSPAGNDLNRFRNVTALKVANVWLRDDPVYHIRQIYPSVVRVDVVKADDPDDLREAFEERIRLKDRFGEKVNNGAHLNDRFVVGWCSDQRPARIVGKFDAKLEGGRKNEGVDIYALKGADIRSATPGTVAAAVKNTSNKDYGQYVQVTHNFKGTSYLITYTNLQEIAVRVGQVLKEGEKIGQSAGNSTKMIVQRPGGGLKGYQLPDVIDPTSLIYWDGLRLRSTVDGLRIRERPGAQFPVKGQVYLYDNVETLELHGRTLQKVGETDNWIRVRAPTGVEGFAAAWYLTAAGVGMVEGVNITGVNLDLTFALGRPTPDRMRGMGWVRFAYNVSQGRGSTDFEAADRFYRPYMERYANAGLRPIIVLGHQTYGEGQGFNWNQMDSEKWKSFSKDFANACREVARRYASLNLVGAYQIWNEQDTPPQYAHAAVALPARDYGNLMAEAIKAIRSVDTRAKIITGGHVTGMVAGPDYVKATLAAMPSSIRPDGVAFHAYGLGAPGSNPRYMPFGALTPTVRAYSRLMDTPVWITEWGVLDMPNEPPADISRYASAFINNLKTYYPDRIAAAIWYGWADGMHNGYGFVDRNDKPKQPFFSDFMKL